MTKGDKAFFNTEIFQNCKFIIGEYKDGTKV